ncbi:choline dehydrogenase [Mesobaculum littorinae]|uniref:Choline dehydrogenase n=1 Tax=Mesobaculum littorinae TaxID=2486419 RepID=A0A438AHI4_9RHOB|nr:GMC family oxidoreductase N-terminal domain-containing protein [Mesobaculum littorinae]RVV98128.1 choline dehydrogenase [Mesobaculum littorinae]
MASESYDYIIAGGGTAGCILANRLTADPAIRVLMVEAGGSGRHLYSEIPLFIPYVIGNPRFDWMLKTEPEPNLGGRVVPLPRGKMLGGSTGINGMVYVRGHRWDYDNWAALGNTGWGWSDVLPYFMRSETWDGEAMQGRGGTGEWRIGDPGMRWPALDAYRGAATQVGIPETPDYNSGDNTGVAYFQANIHGGRRQSTAKAFLHKIAKRPNLTVVTGATVDQITLDGHRATGLLWHKDGEPHHATAKAEVLCCAGAYASPALLERSGIGDPERLRSIGITPLHALPGVGRNLQDHWQVRVQTRLSNTVTLNGRAGSLLGKALMGLDYVTRRKGPLSAQPALLAAFTKVMEDAVAPDVQIHVSAASYDRVGGPMHPYPGITSAVCILRPTSRGHAHARSSDPEAPPEILHNYLDTDYDRQIAVKCVELVRRITGAPAMAHLSPQEVAPGAEVQGHDALLDYARRSIATTFHPVGTCAMGTGTDAVVAPDLRVHGIGGLRVVDASVMPVIPSGNTAAPTVMIAEKAADMIRAAQRDTVAA